MAFLLQLKCITQMASSFCLIGIKHRFSGRTLILIYIDAISDYARPDLQLMIDIFGLPRVVEAQSGQAVGGELCYDPGTDFSHRIQPSAGT
jgi:hypothetical protein